jgi:hypothetical protein
MVVAIIEPVCAGIMVALINKYLLNNRRLVAVLLGRGNYSG